MSPIINNYLIVPKKFFSRFIMPYEILPMFLFCQVGGESYVSKNILDTLLNEGTLNEKYLVISVLHIREESYINFSDISAVHFVNEFALQEFLSRSYSNLEPSMLKLEVLAKGVVDTQKRLDFIEPEGLEKESIANSLRLGDALARILFINISNEGEEFFQKINFSSTYNLTMCLFPSEFKSELEKNIAYSFFQICVKFNIDKGWPQEKVIGEYERQNKDGKPVRWVVLKSGVLERYINGNKYKGEDKWSISREGKFHCEWEQSDIGVFIINQDVSLTLIAYITKKGKRKDHPQEKQFTFKKIK